MIVSIKSYGVVDGAMLVLATDGHCWLIKTGEPEYGDEVDCPVCAEIKAARREAQEGVGMLKMLLEDMTELHAEDCEETECCNILAVKKYIAKMEASL